MVSLVSKIERVPEQQQLTLYRATGELCQHTWQGPKGSSNLLTAESRVRFLKRLERVSEQQQLTSCRSKGELYQKA